MKPRLPLSMARVPPAASLAALDENYMIWDKCLRQPMCAIFLSKLLTRAFLLLKIKGTTRPLFGDEFTFGSRDKKTVSGCSHWLHSIAIQPTICPFWYNPVDVFKG